MDLSEPVQLSTIDEKATAASGSSSEDTDTNSELVRKRKVTFQLPVMDLEEAFEERPVDPIDYPPEATPMRYQNALDSYIFRFVIATFIGYILLLIFIKML